MIALVGKSKGKAGSFGIDTEASRRHLLGCLLLGVSKFQDSVITGTHFTL
jgi:hypothetical protein